MPASEVIPLRPALWAEGPSFITSSYLGENPPDLLERIGVRRDDDAAELDVATLFDAQAS
ncbi:hypothetical protein [Curtobacterium sp. 9128]|uniref:hypothetical protein n=1 Tax=Curtobacterium sp. 9128 TaxID=1793722 RepID=UPI002481C456|nr:hypothetical protein [Curtobacterium sp. 9128]